MSYCRFSSDNFSCDVYVYEACGGGFVTHVAGNRVVGDVPEIPRFTGDNKDEWLKAYRAQRTFMATAEHKPIDLPHAGKSFSDDAAGECADRLEALRALGYTVPQRAIDALRAEASPHALDDDKKGGAK